MKIFGYLGLFSFLVLVICLIWKVWSYFDYLPEGVVDPLALTSLILCVVFGIIFTFSDNEKEE